MRISVFMNYFFKLNYCRFFTDLSIFLEKIITIICSYHWKHFPTLLFFKFIYIILTLRVVLIYISDFPLQ